MATVRGGDLDEVIVDGGEFAMDLHRPGVQRVLALVNGGKVDAVIVDRLTRSVKDLCGLLELFEKRKVALISVAESLDTGSAAGRLVITIMGAVSQWQREAIGERTRDALRHKRGQGQRVGKHCVRGTAGCRRRAPPTATHRPGCPPGDPPGSVPREPRCRDRRRPEHRDYRTRRGSLWRLESVARVLKKGW